MEEKDCTSLPDALLGAPLGDPSSGLLGFFAPPAPRGEAPRLVTVIALHNPKPMCIPLSDLVQFDPELW